MKGENISVDTGGDLRHDSREFIIYGIWIDFSTERGIVYDKDNCSIHNKHMQII